MKSRRDCVDQLITLYNSWKLLSKIDEKERPNHSKIIEFKVKLDALCDLSPKNAYELLKASRLSTWKEDWTFLENQRKVPQIGYMASIDRNLLEMEKRKEERESRLKNRLMPNEVINDEAGTLSSSSSSDD